MNRLPPELESRILATPGTRAGRTVAEAIAAAAAEAEPEPAFDTEKAFMAAVMQEAKRRGWRMYHTHNSRKSAAGFPDLVLVRERVLWIELKTDAGTVAADQANWLEDLAAAGQDVHVWRPKDWPEILHALTTHHASAQQRFVLALAERVAIQSEALSRAAERPQHRRRGSR